MQTLRHTAAFDSAARVLTEAALTAALETIARGPERGDLIPGTGGVRKLRIAASGRGKRGGARVIYYFFDEHNPIYLLTVFAKNERSDISAAERNALRRLTAAMKAEMRARRRR
jgi:hypothetical protein